MNSEPSEGIVFVSDETTGVGLVVKAMAQRHGFKWEHYVERPTSADSSFVFVCQGDEEYSMSFSKEIDKLCSYEEDGSWAACAWYEVHVEDDLVDIDVACSKFRECVDELTDWFLTEHFWYGRGRVAVLGLGELDASECQKIERLFDRLMLELIKSEGKDPLGRGGPYSRRIRPLTTPDVAGTNLDEGSDHER